MMMRCNVNPADAYGQQAGSDVFREAIRAGQLNDLVQRGAQIGPQPRFAAQQAVDPVALDVALKQGETILAALQGLHGRLTDCANRTVGHPAPSNATATDGAKPVPDGKLHQLTVLQADIIRSIQAASSAFDRLDRAL